MDADSHNNLNDAILQDSMSVSSSASDLFDTTAMEMVLLFIRDVWRRLRQYCQSYV